MKTKEEQLEDFKIISSYANQTCPKCYGRGYTEWNLDLQQLIPCGCVFNNVAKAKSEKESSNLIEN